VSVLHLVRHGEAAAGWGSDPDPGLTDLGRRQAAAVADHLDGGPPMPIVVSPLRRTRETAAPLEARWGTPARVEPAVGEIVAPAGQQGLEARAAWLQEAMRGTWTSLGDEVAAWRRLVVACLEALDVDTVVVTHFVAINAAVGSATGDDRVVCCRPGNGSVTRLRNEGGRLFVEALGDQAPSTVL
jgi:broad specificity phosphatase PhoE